MNMNFMAAASSREDIWTRTMDFLNMPDWLKLEMVQSVGAKILHVVISVSYTHLTLPTNSRV